MGRNEERERGVFYNAVSGGQMSTCGVTRPGYVAGSLDSSALGWSAITAAPTQRFWPRLPAI